ncbi:platelet endothelial cell adhesion molecule [Leptonychotes weddellii]|uniref:Platelet endothelial cell adhesion molecule n=1 Tax=Leptonychotes weddellii TaxID=9713 RepID=A0A7F8R7I2_LEPWE|nr:platelet endothelial cell adhesion molecule [Leptonychotes weddellii]
MQLEWAQEGKMWLGLVLMLLLCPSLEGQENSFTINHIYMEILPGQEVQNGENLTLQCIVDISTTSHIKPQHWVLFYKDDVLFHNVSSMETTESYFIPQARVYDAGTYKCTVILNNKEKTTSEYQVWVKGVSDPRVTLDKREAIEGGVVMVNCSVPEEKPPIHFTIEKLKLHANGFKQKREKKKSSYNQNFVMLEFSVEEQDHVIYFQCQATIFSENHMEYSRAIKSELVTVTESFSNPKFHVSPEGVITEGDQLHIRCTIQVTHLVQAFPEIIIQKDKAIVAYKSHGNEASYSVMAMVEHNGNYTCKVEASRISKVSSIVVNITGELLSCSVVQLYEMGENDSTQPRCPFHCLSAPVDEVKLSILLNEDVESGKAVVLRCSVNEASGPITFRFYREKETSPFYQITLNDTQAIWHKAKASKEHEGQYYCTASNRGNRVKNSPQSNILTVRVFLAPWIKGLIAVFAIGVIIAILVLGARCYFLKKAKAKQTPVEMSRPAAPLLNSSNEKMLSDPNTEANRHYGYNEDVGNHAMKPINENKDQEPQATRN